MRINNYFTGFDVEYLEHSNQWRLIQSQGVTEVITASSLKELREYVGNLEKREKCAAFKRFDVLFKYGYGFDRLTKATVTSQEGDSHFWVVFEEENGGKKRRSKLHIKELFQHSPQNLALWEEMKRIDTEAEKLRQSRQRVIEALEPLQGKVKFND